MIFPRFPQQDMEDVELNSECITAQSSGPASSCATDIPSDRYSEFLFSNETPTRVNVSAISTAATTPATIKGERCSRAGKKMSREDVKTDSPNSTPKVYDPQIRQPDNQDLTNKCNSVHIPIRNSTETGVPSVETRLRWFVKMIYWVQQGPDAQLDMPETQLMTISVNNSTPTSSCNSSPSHYSEGASRCGTAQALIRGRRKTDCHPYWLDDDDDDDNNSADDHEGSLSDFGFRTFDQFDKKTYLKGRSSWCTPVKFGRPPIPRIGQRYSGISEQTTDHQLKSPSPILLSTDLQSFDDTRWNSDRVARIVRSVYRMEFFCAVISALMHSFALAISAFTIMLLPSTFSSVVEHPTPIESGNGIMIVGWIVVLLCLALIRILSASRILYRLSKLSASLTFFNADIRIGLMNLYRCPLLNLSRALCLLRVGWLISGFFFLYGRPHLSDTTHTDLSKNNSPMKLGVLLTSFSLWISHRLDLQLLYQYCFSILLLNVALFGVHVVRISASLIGLTFSLLSNSISAVALGSVIMAHPSSSIMKSPAAIRPIQQPRTTLGSREQFCQNVGLWKSRWAEQIGKGPQCVIAVNESNLFSPKSQYQQQQRY